MKIIEALKELKLNVKKINDITARIALNSAKKEFEKSPYNDAPAQIKEWLDAVEGLSKRNGELTMKIAKTNATVQVTIELEGKQITKTIAEWIYRRRYGAAMELAAVKALTNRGLKDEQIKQTDGTLLETKVVLHYDQKTRDQRMDALQQEPTLIDTRLEMINAVTDLLEV